MKTTGNRKKYLSVEEAAKALGKDKKTVIRWVKLGRLRSVERRKIVVRKTMLIPQSTLKDAYTVVCAWCGKIFQARKNPEKARFCCDYHRNLHGMRNRRRMALKTAKLLSR